MTLSPSDEWLPSRLPEVLRREGPYDLAYWQWLALPALVAISWALGYALARVARRLLVRLARGAEVARDDALVGRGDGPLTLGCGLLVGYALSPWLALAEAPRAFAFSALRLAAFLTFYWALARAVDVGRQVIARGAWAATHPSSRALIPLGARAAQALVVVFAGVTVLSTLGIPVASLVAGLGIGGLAVALAAQRTVENLFGAFSLGADQPFREGDFVKIEDFVGTVEAIGLRSTRVRTLDRTLVTIPNGKLAEMRLESLTARDRLRLACTLGLVYGTTAAQLREIVAELERVLRAHPKIWPDAVVVRFKEFGSSSLDVEVMAWFLTSDFAEFQAIRQEINLQFMDVVERAGSSFAFPTRTVHLAKPAA